MRGHGFSKPGLTHSRLRVENQDRVFWGSTGSRTCIALADGGGGMAYSGQGAQTASCSAGAYVLEHFERLFARTSAADVRREVMGRVLAALDDRAKELGLSGREGLGSTLLLLCADREDGRYLCLHLGGGMAGWVERDRPWVISSPGSGIARQFTHLTASPDCVSRTRVYRGCRPDTAFFLMSDGCTPFAWTRQETGDGFSPRVCALLGERRWEEFEAFMDQRRPGDDYSFIALDGQRCYTDTKGRTGEEHQLWKLTVSLR